LRPLISVVIPAYNAAKFLAEAVASVRAQTYRPLELIIVDDGSRDATPDIIQQVERESEAESDPARAVPVRAIFQENAGPSAARNRGLAEAAGPYLAFLDADDRWYPDKLERQWQLLEKEPSVGICCSGWRIINEAGGPTKRLGGAAEGEVTFEALVHQNLIGTPSTVLGRTALFRELGGFDPTLRYAEDLEFWLRAALAPGGKIWSIGGPMIDRRERVGQATRNWHPMREGWLAMLERIRPLAPDRLQVVEPVARALNDRYVAFLAYEAGDYHAARGLVADAWRSAPFALLKSRHTYVTTLAALASLLPRPVHRAVESRVRRWRGGGAGD
jgi:glycosyltransferase involved in cell wall biosynthesis